MKCLYTARFAEDEGEVVFMSNDLNEDYEGDFKPHWELPDYLANVVTEAGGIASPGMPILTGIVSMLQNSLCGYFYELFKNKFDFVEVTAPSLIQNKSYDLLKYVLPHIHNRFLLNRSSAHPDSLLRSVSCSNLLALFNLVRRTKSKNPDLLADKNYVIRGPCYRRDRGLLPGDSERGLLNLHQSTCVDAISLVPKEYGRQEFYRMINRIGVYLCELGIEFRIKMVPLNKFRGYPASFEHVSVFELRFPGMKEWVICAWVVEWASAFNNLRLKAQYGRLADKNYASACSMTIDTYRLTAAVMEQNQTSDWLPEELDDYVNSHYYFDAQRECCVPC